MFKSALLLNKSVEAAQTKIAIQMRPFEKVDWYGWAGAEKFSDGSSPYIGEVTFPSFPEGKGDGATVIADHNGVGVYCMWNWDKEPNKDHENSYYNEHGPHPSEREDIDYNSNLTLDGHISMEGQDKESILNEAEVIITKLQQAVKATDVKEQMAQARQALSGYNFQTF